MSSVKIILRSKVNKDGTSPLALQIIKDRKKSISHLGYHVKATDWDADKQRVKKSHPNSARLNNFIITKLAEANDKILEVETGQDFSSAQSLKDTIKPKVSATFLPQAQEYLNDLQQGGKYNQYTAEKPRVEKFKQFMKGSDIAFVEITPGILNKFVIFLRSYHLKGNNEDKGGKDTRGRNKRPKSKKQMGERTIANHLSLVRNVFAYARRSKLISKDVSPFGKDGIKIKFPDSGKVGISADDVLSLEQVDLQDRNHDHARKVWLFSFYFAGMRASDIFRLRWSDFQNCRLHYSMGKNNKGGSLKVPDKAIPILEYCKQFRENENDLVFPELKNIDLSDDFITQRTIAFKTSALDKVLRQDVALSAGITAKLTMHIARHTFATLAGDTIPIQMLQKLYRHSNVATTIGYQANFINQAADDALDAVINKIKKTVTSPN